MKPTPEKRTTTQPGLGKVTPRSGDTSSVDPGTDQAPVSVPPASIGRDQRVTRSLEKAVSSVRVPSQAPVSEKPISSERGRAHAIDPRADTGVGFDPRAEEGEPSPSARVERVESRERRPSDARAPIDVTTVDPRRVANSLSTKPPALTSSSRPRPMSSKPPPSMSRRSLTGLSATDVANGRRPSTGTMSKPVTLAVAPVTTSGPARSKRVSLREDNLGSGVSHMADAVGTASRTIPKLLKTKAEIAAAPIDHRAGFLLAHVDGVTSVAGLVDICGMPEEEVEQILERLRRLGIVAVR